ncbi:MAG TPA: MarR family transcriptional regulator, partial [Pseudonocardiaceae bacterium]|nr:MarR family transcriptional regulator [Pseudonocardiaceae bacterium]
MPASGDRVDELIARWRAELPEVLGPTSELVKRLMLLDADLAAATRAELPAFDLTPAEHDVLAALRRNGKPYRMKPNELSRSLLLSSGG